MIQHFFDGRPWFHAKSHGLGAGLPLAWQGWVLLAIHLALLTGLGLALGDKPVAATVAIIVAATLPLPLYHAKTQGGWRWRWGRGRDARKGNKRKPRQ